MNLAQAIQSGFRNYVNFSGRSSRSEYWCWMLFTFAVLFLVMMFVDDERMDWSDPTHVVPLLIIFAFVPPSYAVLARRLHDVDRSAWWILVVFIPLVGVIAPFVVGCLRGTPGSNRFGADPLATVPGEP